MLLVVGLGNPGLRYRDTRHNVGFRCVDAMSKKWGIPVKDRRAKAVLGTGRLAGQDIVLAKPRTFMNNSGDAVFYLLTRFASMADDLVIVYDEMELPLCRLRIRATVSDGGHYGMRSIIATVKTEAFPRIRLGIGPPSPEHRARVQNFVPYVLGRFSKEEAAAVSQAVANVVAAVECMLEENIDVAMNRFN